MSFGTLGKIFSLQKGSTMRESWNRESALWFSMLYVLYNKKNRFT